MLGARAWLGRVLLLPRAGEETRMAQSPAPIPCQPTTCSSSMGHKDWMDKCVCLLTAFSEHMRRVPVALPEMVHAFSAQQQTLKQIVICGDRQAKDTKALVRCVHSVYIPNKVLILADGDPLSFLSCQLPFLSTLRRLEDQATAYVCENQACSMPITDPCELRKLLHP
ncbi:spermatogenesis-associated protein 20-like [Nomascus leucogenys]|uniref:spermatogenesis-associated protein 20-like n=1 Tax=Nomascus leucogenys TaxID=61853 RepID=UPI00122D7608|nr:spermatogenesis-associated protein 20-like [Nomascus leucogenys]